MIKTKKVSASTLFLMELMIAILFFTICCSICLQIFAKSHTISEQSEQSLFAADRCSCVAETIFGVTSFTEARTRIQGAFPESVETAVCASPAKNDTSDYSSATTDDLNAETFFYLYYDTNYITVSSIDQAAYVQLVQLYVSEDRYMLNMNQYFYEASEYQHNASRTIYSLSTCSHMQREVN